MGFKKKDAEIALKVSRISAKATNLERSQDAVNDLHIAVETLYYKANAEFVKIGSIQKKTYDFTDITNPMGLLLE